MSGISRPAKGLTTGTVLLAALLLASCGGGDAPATAADETAMPADAVAGAAAEPAADTAQEPAGLELAAASNTAPGKGGAQPASQSAGQPTYIGSWGVDLAQCALDQEYEGSPMILYANGFDQHEAHCGFDSVTRTGIDEWHVTGQCSVEGDEQVIDDNIAVIDGNLHHWAGDDRKNAWVLVRCPE